MRQGAERSWIIAVVVLSWFLSEWAVAGSSPFATGATSAKSEVLAIVTPFAAIAVMALGVLALFGKIAWHWVVGAISGIILIFAADPIVSTVRGWIGA